MSENTEHVSTHVTKKVSDGTVKLSIERYEELLRKAAEKTPVVYNTVQKTQSMIAEDNKVWGGIILAGGVCLSIIGAGLHLLGRAQERSLEKEMASKD